MCCRLYTYMFRSPYVMALTGDAQLFARNWTLHRHSSPTSRPELLIRHTHTLIAGRSVVNSRLLLISRDKNRLQIINSSAHLKPFKS
jgi:hypothetical protein